MTGASNTADSLRDVLAAARDRAAARGRPVLASVIEEIGPLDPLDVLLGATDTSLRSYWCRPDQKFELAGIGAAITLGATGDDRFDAVDREWRDVLADALVGGDAGTARGPVLMGGFSFEPDGPRSARWKRFPSARLAVPGLLVARDGARCTITMSSLVHAGLDVEAEAARLRDRCRSALNARVDDVDDASGDVSLTDEMPTERWRALVARAAACIRDGALSKVVLARDVRADADDALDVGVALRSLRTRYPSCFVFGMFAGDDVFVGATPERLARVDGRAISVSCLAGSIGRGAEPADDRERAAELLASAKNRREHAIVVETVRDALRRTADEVTARDEPSILTLPHVHHLHTEVRATLREGGSLLSIAGALHPTPAVGGMPRGAALEFIRNEEGMDRGWYAAPVGWVARDGGEFAVALRSALVSGARAWLYAGCGIVGDSDPDEELAESALKLRPMATALGVASDVASAATR